MACFTPRTNEDCEECIYSGLFDDPEGDQSDWYCNKENTSVAYKSATEKPCGLEEGRNYIAVAS